MAAGTFNYEWVMSIENENIREYPKLISEWLEKGDLESVARGYDKLAQAYVMRSLIRWRHGESPVEDLNSGFETYTTFRTFLAAHPLGYELIAPYADLYALSFSLIGKKVEIPPLDDYDRSLGKLATYPRYLAEIAQGVAATSERCSDVNHFLETGNSLLDETYRVYLKLLGEIPSAESADALVVQAEKNWKKRRNSKQFAGFGLWEGHDYSNDGYPDLTLAAVLKIIGWRGDSVHRWTWDDV